MSDKLTATEWAKWFEFGRAIGRNLLKRAAEYEATVAKADEQSLISAEE